MTSNIMRHALKVTKAFAYGEATLGDAKAAWAAFDGNWAYVRRQYGSLHFEAYSLVMAYAFTISTWEKSDPRRAKNQANLCAVIKAVLALIEGAGANDDFAQSPPSDRFAATSPALRGEDKGTVLDLKRIASGERDD